MFKALGEVRPEFVARQGNLSGFFYLVRYWKILLLAQPVKELEWQGNNGDIFMFSPIIRQLIVAGIWLVNFATVTETFLHKKDAS